MVPDYNTVDKAKSLMEKVRNGEVVTQEEADAPVAALLRVQIPSP